MKPAAFEYHDPRTTAEALALLAQHGDEAKALAGGQSLVPLMNFRLARPARLVDLNFVAELDYLRVDAGTLRIGAMSRQRELETSPLVAAGWPLLREATAYIGHAPIRNRGTVGGSIAHADPAAELPAAMAALDATLVIRGPGGERTLASDEFYLGYLTTALAPDELLVELRLPPLAPRTGCAFVEFARRHGDYALVGVAARLTLGDDAAIREARLAFIGAAPTPLRTVHAEAAIVGERPSESLFRGAAQLASLDLEPESDLHASADYRREVGGALARRALLQAAARAAERRN